MCNGTLLSLGKEQSNAICAAIWMDLEIISQNEVSQKRKKDKSNDITSMWNLKKTDTIGFFTKQKQTHRYTKQPYGYEKGKEIKDKLEVWD